MTVLLYLCSERKNTKVVPKLVYLCMTCSIYIHNHIHAYIHTYIYIYIYIYYIYINCNCPYCHNFDDILEWKHAKTRDGKHLFLLYPFRIRCPSVALPEALQRTWVAADSAGVRNMLPDVAWNISRAYRGFRCRCPKMDDL